MRNGVIAVACLALVVAAAAAGARRDTAPIQNSPDLPWTNPSHQSNLELLLGPIASRIANRNVTIRCEGDTDWVQLVTQQGGNPNAELGYVSATFSATTRQATSIATFAELRTAVCTPLKAFAAANPKPTKCVPIKRTPATTKRVKTTIRKRVTINGVPTWKTVPTTKTITIPGTTTTGEPTPCYIEGDHAAANMPESYWDAYEDYSQAILTLAHEAIHLGGVVGATLRNGLTAGDAQAEAKASCYGMQWMPYVATELGATPDDAQAIATYYWERIYPNYRNAVNAQYWSANCTPGGSMDIRPPGSTSWP
ncbi:MAG: hypothetical protein F2663_02490 [Actinobacteria bacterium]|nr:hypothetical protein [Actinomycetota bacterium]